MSEERTSSPSPTAVAIQKIRDDERAKIVAWLKTIPVAVIDDWGLNATGNIIEWLEGDKPLPVFEEVRRG